MLIREYKTKIDIQLHDMLYAQRKFEIAVVIFFEFRVRFLLYFFLSEIVHDLWKKKKLLSIINIKFIEVIMVK